MPIDRTGLIRRALPDLLTDDDRRLWREVMHGVRPLPGRALPPLPIPLPPTPPAVPPAAAPPPPPKPAPRPTRVPEAKHAAVAGLDARSAQRLRRGQLPVEARLDLHGMTQDAAHAALNAFLGGSQTAGRRMVLVITGKGFGGDAGGILRRAVPRWLHEGANRGRVLAYAPARPQHGGGGALYVLLRRRREP